MEEVHVVDAENTKFNLDILKQKTTRKGGFLFFKYPVMNKNDRILL